LISIQTAVQTRTLIKILCTRHFISPTTSQWLRRSSLYTYYQIKIWYWTKQRYRQKNQLKFWKDNKIKYLTPDKIKFELLYLLHKLEGVTFFEVVKKDKMVFAWPLTALTKKNNKQKQKILYPKKVIL